MYPFVLPHTLVIRPSCSSLFSEPQSSSIGRSILPLDFIEKPDAYLLKADAPGMEKEDIHIEVRENRLCLKGERKEEKEEQDGKSSRYERSHRSFCRSLQLPKDADASQIQATLDKGVLRISVPRKEIEDNVKKIEIS